MSIVVIYGPQMSGKTFHAESFRAHYSCGRVVDEWDPKFRRGRPPLEDGDLVLTTASASDIVKRISGDVRLVEIGKARLAIGEAERFVR